MGGGVPEVERLLLNSLTAVPTDCAMREKRREMWVDAVK